MTQQSIQEAIKQLPPASVIKAHMERVNLAVAKCAEAGHVVLCDEHAREVRELRR